MIRLLSEGTTFHVVRLKTIAPTILRNRTCTQDEFGDTKGVIRIRKSKKNRQHNGQKKKDKYKSTKHTHKTKDRVHWHYGRYVVLCY